MAKYRMQDGTVVDTLNARASWEESRDHDGSNFISRATGTQWTHQTLYESRKGRFYLEHTSDWQGSMPHVEWISEEEAVRWLLHNDKEVPDRLKALIETVSE